MLRTKVQSNFKSSKDTTLNIVLRKFTLGRFSTLLLSFLYLAVNMSVEMEVKGHSEH